MVIIISENEKEPDIKTEPEEVVEKPVKAAAKKAAKKPAEKPADKPKKDKSGLDKFEDQMEKLGYVDMYDYLTLIAGVWGMIWWIILFFSYVFGGGYGNFVGMGGLSSPLLSSDSNDAWAGLFLLIMMFWVYINLILYPTIIDKLGMKIVGKRTFPLHFIKTKEDLRAFIVFLSFWSCIFFAVAGWGLRWPHIISFIILTIVILADPLSEKWNKVPGKKIRE